MPSVPLPVRLQNSSTPIKAGSWSWVVWVEGPEDALDLIRSVRYTLHHTFPDPVRIVTDRSTKFALTASGWGEFSIRAEVTPHAGSPFHLEHWLTLTTGDAAAKGEGRDRQPTLFVSYGANDVRLFHTLRKELRDEGIRVICAEDSIDAGASWPQECGDVIASADAAAFFTSGALRGFAEVEVEQALKHNKPIIPIVVGTGTAPKALQGIEGVHVDAFGSTGAATAMLVARVKDAFYPDES